MAGDLVAPDGDLLQANGLEPGLKCRHVRHLEVRLQGFVGLPALAEAISTRYFEILAEHVGDASLLGATRLLHRHHERLVGGAVVGMDIKVALNHDHLPIIAAHRHSCQVPPVA